MKDQEARERIDKLEDLVEHLTKRSELKYQLCPKCDRKTLQRVEVTWSEGRPRVAYHCTQCDSVLKCKEVIECIILNEGHQG